MGFLPDSFSSLSSIANTASTASTTSTLGPPPRPPPNPPNPHLQTNTLENNKSPPEDDEIMYEGDDDYSIDSDYSHHHHHEEEEDEVEEAEEEKYDDDDDDMIILHDIYATRSTLINSKDRSPLEKDKKVLDNLCSGCSRLNISTKKFIIHGNHKVPPVPYVFDATGFKSVELGYLDDIYSRRSKYRGGRRVLCDLDWQLDGRKGNPTSIPNQGHVGQGRSKALTRRARLYSKTDAFPNAFIVLLPHHAWKLKPPTFLGRFDQQINPDQMRRWISTCQKHHGGACRPLPNAEPTTQKIHMDKIKFIDVDQLCLVDAPFESTEYIALSYIWGRTNQLVLLGSNFQVLNSIGGFGVMHTALPRTIQDSIRLVKLLGFRYLWVDCLCIQQDDDNNKRVLIDMMDRINGNSVLTICAASGGDSEAGLPGIWQPRESSQYRERYAEVDLLVVRPVEGRIKDTIWNSRAWTFQERLLSNRCLIFVDDRVFFQCRQATWSEELDCEANIPTWNLDMIGSPLVVFKENPLRRYTTCVQLYSGRMLSYYHDKLHAFKGISNVLGKPLKARFHYGLPNSYFDWALLWDINLPGTWTGHVNFPSWSWSGWSTAVEWRLSTTANILNNMYEWLSERTWVVWFISTLDSSNELEPELEPELKLKLELVWDATPGKEKSTRWDGYGAGNDQTPYGRSSLSEMILEVSAFESVPTCPPIEGCLHFWTYSAIFSLTRTSISNAAFKSNLKPGLHRFGIQDAKGDWCGTIILNETFFNQVDGQFEFIAISEAKDFELEEFDSWTYYIPQEREQAEWYLYYALMIRWNKEGIAERLGLAKIYKMAFHSASFKPGLR